MIEGLILGKLHAPAVERQATTGRRYVTAKVRCAVGDNETAWVNVIAFSESACTALLALDPGDSVALAGTLKPSAWQDHEGRARPSVDLVAATVMTVYGLARKRKASPATGAASGERDEVEPGGGDAACPRGGR